MVIISLFLQFVLVSIPSSYDGTMQPVQSFEIDAEAPLLVGLHPWMGDHADATGSEYLELAKRNGWHMVYPNFRGREVASKLGSIAAVHDVVDAINFMKGKVKVTNVYLVGTSGGGNMALRVLAAHPDLADIVISQAAPTDLTEWYKSTPNKGFKQDIRAICGGNPLKSERAAKRCRKRSPDHRLKKIRSRSKIYISHGLYDEVVPYSHAISAFDSLRQQDNQVFLNIGEYAHDADFQQIEQILISNQ